MSDDLTKTGGRSVNDAAVRALANIATDAVRSGAIRDEHQAKIERGLALVQEAIETSAAATAASDAETRIELSRLAVRVGELVAVIGATAPARPRLPSQSVVDGLAQSKTTLIERVAWILGVIGTAIASHYLSGAR